MDITQLEQAGFTPWEATMIEYASNPRNAFKYFIKFLYFTYNDEAKNMIAYFRVIRMAQQNGEWRNDISYVFDSVANDTTYVDKDGVVVSQFITQGEEQVLNPVAWGTEFKRMQILFNAPIKDSEIVESYQQILFDRGLFDFPKN